VYVCEQCHLPPFSFYDGVIRVHPTSFVTRLPLRPCLVLPDSPQLVTNLSSFWIRWFLYLLSVHRFSLQLSMVVNSLVILGEQQYVSVGQQHHCCCCYRPFCPLIASVIRSHRISPVFHGVRCGCHSDSAIHVEFGSPGLLKNQKSLLFSGLPSLLLTGFDDCPLLFPFQPHLVVQTRVGFHLRWLCGVVSYPLSTIPWDA